MPEIIQERRIFSLSEVAGSIERTLMARYKSAFWIKAEMIKLNFYSHTGHCYPDLAEKKGEKIVAQMRATLWKTDYQRIEASFRKITGESIKNGIMALLKVEIVYDASHGITLHILDIDPSFSLGEMEKEKTFTLLRLKEEGFFDKNKALKLPLLPQKIAVISVETSKGYADFTNILQNNSFGYHFNLMLFPSILQGDVAVKNIIRQMNRIRRAAGHFDAVVIVRGGGGDVGLSCYNNYELAHCMATFPLPVLTGIGHATNETIAEMIAWKNAITPTELANFFIGCFHRFAQPLQQAQQRISSRVRLRLQGEEQKLENAGKMLALFSSRSLERQLQYLHQKRNQLNQIIKSQLQAKQNTFNQWENTLQLCDPEKVLQRGYSMVLQNGKVVKSINNIHKGENIETILADGRFEAQILLTETNKKQ